MYIPPHFVFDVDDEIQELIRRWPLATVVVHGSDGLAANHIPLIIDQEQAGLILHGHIARANKLSRIDDATSALAVFMVGIFFISSLSVISCSCFFCTDSHSLVAGPMLDSASAICFSY